MMSLSSAFFIEPAISNDLGISFRPKDHGLIIFSWRTGNTLGDGNENYESELLESIGLHHGLMVEHQAISKPPIHGFGSVRLQNNVKFQGNFNDGSPTDGYLLYPNGDVYDGEVSRFRPNGIGKLEFANGGGYEGEFLVGLYDGHGRLTLSNGDVFEGEFDDGVVHGEAEFFSYNNYSFEGRFHRGSPAEGTLSVVSTDGVVLMHGKFGQSGDVQHPATKRLTLELIDEGSEYSERYGSYSGYYVNGVPDGEGISTYYSLKKAQDAALTHWYTYDGMWKNGLPNGEGVMIFPVDVSNYLRAGAKIEGTFKDGLPVGVFTITVPVLGKQKARFVQATLEDGTFHEDKASIRDVQDAYQNPAMVTRLGRKEYKLTSESMVQLSEFKEMLEHGRQLRLATSLAPLAKFLSELPVGGYSNHPTKLIAEGLGPRVLEIVTPTTEWEHIHTALDGVDRVTKEKIKNTITFNYLSHQKSKGDDRQFWFDFGSALGLPRFRGRSRSSVPYMY